MKQSKKIKFISSLSSVVILGPIVLSTGFTTKLQGKAITPVFVTRSIVSSNDLDAIKAEVTSDNSVVFSRYRGLKEACNISVQNDPDVENKFNISITNDDTSKYEFNAVGWDAIYIAPEPEPSQTLRLDASSIPGTISFYKENKEDADYYEIHVYSGNKKIGLMCIFSW